MARKRAAEREIKIPRVKSSARKSRCKNDLAKFAQTYFSKPPDKKRYPTERGLCYLPFSPLHLSVISEFEKSIRYGGNDALAVMRGFGKDTIAIVATIWALFYGHLKFVVFACYEMRSAADRIEMVKHQIEINSLLMADFPEVCAPLRALDRAPQRAKQQTYRGEFTRSEWGGVIVLPTIPRSRASGGILAPGSLGGSIRGINHNGRRPDYVIITDPQTREVASSPSQTDDVMKKIRADFGGLGAADTSMSALALVTPMKRGDVADQLTDPSEMPMWNGRRHPAIVEWPERADLWAEYEQLLDSGSRSGDKDGRGANKFYIEHRAEMDKGAVVCWESAYSSRPSSDGTPLENSALQHFMNLRWRIGPEAFSAEYQVEPPEEDGMTAMSPEAVASRLSTYPPCIIPEGATTLVQGIDVSGREIHYTVLACADDATGSVIDYGRIQVDTPEGDLRDPHSTVRPALERAILGALRRRRDEIYGEANPYKNTSGEPVEIQLSFVDSGWLPQVIYAFCNESGPRWQPVKGWQFTPGNTKYSQPARSMRIKTGAGWHAQRTDGGQWIYHIDADHWKLHVQERFTQTEGTAGAWNIFGTDPKEHLRHQYAKHICAEEWDLTQGKFIRRSKWNHYLDTTAYAAAAAAICGAALVREKASEEHEAQEKAWGAIIR